MEHCSDLNWSERLFSQVPEGEADLIHFYMGDDNEERYNGVDELFRSHTEEAPPKFGPRVEISKEKYISLFSKWRGALIVKLFGKSISFRVLEQRVRALWNLQQGFELTDLEEGYFIVRFYSRDDYLHVLEGGPWVIFGHYLTVKCWRPLFRPSTDCITSTLVWVRFPGILSELLDEEILSSIGDMVGRTVKVDPLSLTGLRSKFARVCVEVDLVIPLIPSLTVLDMPQRVEYEGLHLICFQCGKYGHRGDDCPPLYAPVSDPINAVPLDSAPPDSTDSSDPKPSSPFGPWMLPEYQKKKLLLQRRQAVPQATAENLTSPNRPTIADHDRPEPVGPHSRKGTTTRQHNISEPSGPSHQMGSRFQVLEGLD